jgi:IS6 family transposase
LVGGLPRDICGEARIVERAFGVGPSALSETIALIGNTLNLQPA